MSTRSAHLLMLVADSLQIAANAGAFRKLGGYSEVPVHNGLAGEILAWERGHLERLAHIRAASAGELLVARKTAANEERLRDDEAIHRVREIAEARDMNDIICLQATEALKMLEGLR